MIPIDIFLINYKGKDIEKYAEMIQLDRNMLENVMMSKKIDFLFFKNVSDSCVIKFNLVLFAISLFLSFFLIPFSYFYGDERIEDIKPQQNELKEKICNSLKYTVK